MVDVLWEGKTLVMFYADIEMRGEVLAKGLSG
jgi:hypothetical protein